MKCKIAILTTLVIILNCVFCYAEDDTVVNMNGINYSYEHIFGDSVEYDKASDTYYFIQPGQERSGAVAVAGSTLSAILALATKAGLEFASSNSMSEFLNRFFMLDGIKSIISEVDGVVSSSVGGVLNFSRSLLDTVKSKFAEVMSTHGDVGSMYYRGKKYITVVGDITFSEMRYVFDKAPSLGTYTYSELSSTDSSNPMVINTGLPYRSSNGELQIQLYTDGSGWIVYKGYDTSSLYSPSMSGGTGYFSDGYNYSIHPYISTNSSGTSASMSFILARVDTNTLFYSDATTAIPYDSLPQEYFGTKFPLPTVGEAWSDSIPGNGKDTTADLDIKIPSDTNSLVGLPSDSVTDNPTYAPWTPGIVVTPPTIDTGSDDVVDVPDYDVIPDSPGDTDTEKPDSPSISWDWLKNLLNKLLEMIQTIIDWLTSFWDKLLEFIQGLLVPGEDYFVDEFGKITEKLEEKVPSVDITKLESLAVEEAQFKDIYAEFFGVRCLVVRASLINNILDWAKPIIQGLIALFLLLYNYNQIYFLIRGSSLLGASNTINNMDNNRIGGRR